MWLSDAAQSYANANPEKIVYSLQEAVVSSFSLELEAYDNSPYGGRDNTGFIQEPSSEMWKNDPLNAFNAQASYYGLTIMGLAALDEAQVIMKDPEVPVSQKIYFATNFFLSPRGKGKGIKKGRSRSSLHGTGSAKGIIELGGHTKSRGAFNSLDTKGTDFVYDHTTGKMAIQSNNSLVGGHDRLKNSLGSSAENIVGGRLTKSANGKTVLTNEWSGHYGDQWTPEIRSKFVSFLEKKTGKTVEHTAWGE